MKKQTKNNKNKSKTKIWLINFMVVILTFEYKYDIMTGGVFYVYILYVTNGLNVINNNIYVCLCLL